MRFHIMVPVPEFVAILEDHPGRIAEMQSCIAELLPGTQSVFFDDAQLMINWLGEHLGEVVLISLDHYLPLRVTEAGTVDCGTGRQVANYLAYLPPTCPVIVHTSNHQFAPAMLLALMGGGWPRCRVYPSDGEAWVRGEWAEQIHRYLNTGWLRPSQQPPSRSAE